MNFSSLPSRHQQQLTYSADLVAKRAFSQARYKVCTQTYAGDIFINAEIAVGFRVFTALYNFVYTLCAYLFAEKNVQVSSAGNTIFPLNTH